jgi:hypothetical protein
VDPRLRGPSAHQHTRVTMIGTVGETHGHCQIERNKVTMKKKHAAFAGPVGNEQGEETEARAHACLENRVGVVQMRGGLQVNVGLALD